VPSFKTLCSTTTDEFYEKDRGTNYAQRDTCATTCSNKGCCGTSTGRFHVNCKEDPTGYATLQELLGRKDMPSFSAIGAYVLKLRFR